MNQEQSIRLAAKKLSVVWKSNGEWRLHYHTRYGSRLVINKGRTKKEMNEAVKRATSRQLLLF